MRLLESLLSGHPIGFAQMPASDPRERLNAFGDLPAVEADAAWRWYWHADDKWDLASGAFGRLRLPFTQMLIEGQMPSRIRLTNPPKWTNRNADLRRQLMYVAQGPADKVIKRFGLQGQLPASEHILLIFPLFWSGRVNDYIAVPQVTIFFPVTDDGVLVLDDNVPLLHFPPENVDDEQETQEFADAMLEMIKPALLTVALMHCKNVSLEEKSLPAAVERKRRRDGKAIVRWSTIKLPSAASSTSDAQHHVGENVALHVVRGHFKTYTEDAPLMGQHVGTYWWAAHARGDEAVGTVKHRYEVTSGRHERQ